MCRLVRSNKRRQECLSIRANVLGCREDTGEDHRTGMAFQRAIAVINVECGGSIAVCQRSPHR